MEDDVFSFLKLGDYYYYGIGHERNFETAMQYYNLVVQAQRNNTFTAQAAYNLAYMCLHGEGHPINETRSDLYFQVALEILENMNILNYPLLQLIGFYQKEALFEKVSEYFQV